MKRTLILTAMLSAMVTLHAQGIKFGLIAGVDVSNPTNGAEMTKLGYRFGMKAESDFSNNTFLNVSVLLASKGYKTPVYYDGAAHGGGLDGRGVLLEERWLQGGAGMARVAGLLAVHGSTSPACVPHPADKDRRAGDHVRGHQQPAAHRLQLRWRRDRSFCHRGGRRTLQLRPEGLL